MIQTLRLLTVCLSVAVVSLACSPTPCGNKKVEDIEQCDDGRRNNADDVADACRTDCRLPWCGDGTKDSGEQCDDGNNFGGDGCDSTCVTESGIPEVEPNDTPFLAQVLTESAVVTGSLPEGDRDCFAMDLMGEGSWIKVEMVGAAKARRKSASFR